MRSWLIWSNACCAKSTKWQSSKQRQAEFYLSSMYKAYQVKDDRVAFHYFIKYEKVMCNHTPFDKRTHRIHVLYITGVQIRSPKSSMSHRNRWIRKHWYGGYRRHRARNTALTCCNNTAYLFLLFPLFIDQYYINHDMFKYDIVHEPCYQMSSKMTFIAMQQ